MGCTTAQPQSRLQDSEDLYPSCNKKEQLYEFEFYLDKISKKDIQPSYKGTFTTTKFNSNEDFGELWAKLLADAMRVSQSAPKPLQPGAPLDPKLKKSIEGLTVDSEDHILRGLGERVNRKVCLCRFFNIKTQRFSDLMLKPPWKEVSVTGEQAEKNGGLYKYFSKRGKTDWHAPEDKSGNPALSSPGVDVHFTKEGKPYYADKKSSGTTYKAPINLEVILAGIYASVRQLYAKNNKETFFALISTDASAKMKEDSAAGGRSVLWYHRSLLGPEFFASRSPPAKSHQDWWSVRKKNDSGPAILSACGIFSGRGTRLA